MQLFSFIRGFTTLTGKSIWLLLQSCFVCSFFFLIRNVFGTNHWQLFSLVEEILNDKEELASKGFYCSKGLSAQQIPYGYLLPDKDEG